MRTLWKGVAGLLPPYRERANSISGWVGHQVTSRDLARQRNGSEAGRLRALIDGTRKSGKRKTVNLPTPPVAPSIIEADVDGTVRFLHSVLCQDCGVIVEAIDAESECHEQSVRQT